MAEDKFNSNIKSPRFSTTKALGFKGGSTNAQTGNLQTPTFQQVSGINPERPKAPTAADTAPISQFSAGSVPQPKLAGAIAGPAAAAVGGEALKRGGQAAGNAISNAVDNFTRPKGYLPEGGYSSGTMNQSFASPDNMSMIPGSTNAVAELGGRPEVPSFLQSQATPGADSWDFGAGGGLDFGGDTASTAADAWDFGGDAGSAVTGEVPIVGPLIRAAQGDYGGAAGSAIGGAIGSAILPGIGTAVGSALGGFFGGGCFITEAVMSSGGADGGMELEALRGFRDNILSKTPQGQAMIAEYEAIAPVVVECVSQRQDGVQIFQQIKGQFIDPAVQAVQQGNYQEALQIYASMIAFVTPFAAEAAEAGMGGGDPDEMNAMGDHAAMVGNVPEYSGEAMPDGGMGGGDMPMMPSPAGAMPPMGGGNMMPQPSMQQQRPAIGNTFARRF